MKNPIKSRFVKWECDCIGIQFQSNSSEEPKDLIIRDCRNVRIAESLKFSDQNKKKESTPLNYAEIEEIWVDLTRLIFEGDRFLEVKNLLKPVDLPGWR